LAGLGETPRPVAVRCPYIEGQAVRTWVGVAVVTVCLGLAGCSLFGKKQSARNANPKPFTGAEAPAQRETAAVTDPGAPLPGASGLLAGRVVDLATGRPVKASIEVKDIEEENVKTARLDVETTGNDGYFTILKLKPGHYYRLIARDREGGGLASRPVIVIPPKPNLYIEVSRDFTTPDTPPAPEPPKVPDKKGATGTGSIQERAPAATLAPPVRIPPSKESDPTPPPPPNNGTGASQGGGNSGNISNIAEGFARSPDSAPANINGPGQQYQSAPWPPPPPPQWERMGEERPPRPAPPNTPSGPPGSIHLPTQPTRVPSCVLIGNKLENFALDDVNGGTWEYRRDRRGRLVLLDFWYSTCHHCLLAIPHLIDLQKKYGPYGLEVIGIACETGTVPEQVSRVRGVRGRYHINYPTLLSGGDIDHSPVMNQFDVKYFPKLVLLDESGKIIWESSREGLDDYVMQTLERVIQQKLNIRPR
jgi:thiol-disulfide isomerase/thioredoxin